MIISNHNKVSDKPSEQGTQRNSLPEVFLKVTENDRITGRIRSDLRECGLQPRWSEEEEHG